MKAITATITFMNSISKTFSIRTQASVFKRSKTKAPFQQKDGDTQPVCMERKCSCLEVEIKKIEMNFILIAFKQGFGINFIILTSLLECDDDVIQCL